MTIPRTFTSFPKWQALTSLGESTFSLAGALNATVNLRIRAGGKVALDSPRAQRESLCEIIMSTGEREAKSAPLNLPIERRASTAREKRSAYLAALEAMFSAREIAHSSVEKE